jgi:phosphoglycolate phosphatase
MTYRAVVFDLDGTLLDTLADIAGAMNRVLRRLGLPEHPVAAYKYWVGEGISVLVERVLPADRADAATRAACAAAMRAEYGAHWAVASSPYPEIPALLDALTARGMALAVLSNKPDDLARRCVAHYLPRWPFAVVMGEEPRRPRKPDPAGALEIARQLAIPPRECIYLGDTGTDMQTAVAAGMYPVGALWGFREAAELRAAGAAVLIARPPELLRLLAPHQSQ